MAGLLVRCGRCSTLGGGGCSRTDTVVARLRSLRSRYWERIRSNLFFVPVAFAVGAGVVAEALLELDRRIDDFPDRLTATVDSARAVLGLVAGATLTFAAIAFSVSLLLISAASSQFSPRVVHGLFRDPFNKRVMGVVVGTFVYCLVVMRAVRGPLEDAGEAVVPSLSIIVGAVLGVVAILSIVAFINHAAHSMEVSTMLDRVTREAFKSLPPIDDVDPESTPDDHKPEGDGFVVVFAEHGWVQIVDGDQILEVLPPGSTVRIDTAAGRYAIPRTPICHVWPPPDEPEQLATAIRKAVTVGPSRTLQQDETFGVRQLADVALKALSPGINDPTTAQDALFHMGALVRELLDRRPIERVRTEGDKTLIAPQLPTPQDLVELAFDEVRVAAAGAPTVLIYLLEILQLVRDSLDSSEHSDAVDALTRQAALVAEIGERSDLPPADHERVSRAFSSRFG